MSKKAKKVEQKPERNVMDTMGVKREGWRLIEAMRNEKRREIGKAVADGCQKGATVDVKKLGELNAQLQTLYEVERALVDDFEDIVLKSIDSMAHDDNDWGLAIEYDSLTRFYTGEWNKRRASTSGYDYDGHGRNYRWKTEAEKAMFAPQDEKKGE